MRLSPVIAFLCAVAGASASAIRHKRACEADNVLRALRNSAHSASASNFCFTYIQSTTVTTVTATTVVVSSTSTTLPAPTAALTETETDTAIVSSTFTTYSANPVVISTETTFTVLLHLPPVKRQVGSTLYPGEPTELATYPPSRISSACSCFISLPPVATSTSTVTSTTSTTLISVLGPLSTSTETIDVSTTTTVTSVSSVTLPATSTVSVSETVTIAVSQCTNVANLPTYSQPIAQIDLKLIENPVDVGVAASQEACCVACYELENCASFEFYISLTDHKVCDLFTVESGGLDPLSPSSNQLCPLGELSISSITNLDPSITFTDTVNLGPCGSP